MCVMFGNHGMNPVRSALMEVDVPFFVLLLDLEDKSTPESRAKLLQVWKELEEASQAINPGELEQMVECALKIWHVHPKRPWKEYIQG